MEENVDKTLRAYADGSLSGEALEAFEPQLEQDPDLRSELDLYLALKAMDNLRLKKQLQQIEVAEDVSSGAVHHSPQDALDGSRSKRRTGPGRRLVAARSTPPGCGTIWK